MIRRGVWTLVMMLGTVAACTSSDPTPDNDTIELRITARVIICSPELRGDIRDCGDIRLPNAEVAISSGGETVWTGDTNHLGRAEARFSADGEFVVTVTSPWLRETTTSEPLTSDVGPDVTIFTEDRYLLTPVPPLEE